MKTLYRILAPIFCIAAIPVFFFLPLVRINITSNLTDKLMGSLGIKEYNSIYSIIKAVSGGSETSIFKTIASSLGDKDTAIGKMLTNVDWLYAFVAFFIITVVLMLVIAGFAAFSKKYTLGFCLSLGAVVSTFVMNKCFDGFAKPFLSGEIGISSLLSASDTSGLLSSLLGNVVTIKYLSMGAAYQAVLLIACIVTILAVCAVVENKNQAK